MTELEASIRSSLDYIKNCLLCGSRGSNCTQILEQNREKWSQNWCSLFNIHTQEVKLMIRNAFYCVECKGELGTIENLLTEVARVNTRLDIIKVNSLYKVKDSLQSVQSNQNLERIVDPEGEDAKKRLMLFECMRSSSPVTAETLALIRNVKSEPEFVDRRSILKPNHSSSVPVKMLNTTTTKVNPFLHAFHAEFNSVPVPKDEDGLILQRLSNLKELTIKVNTSIIPRLEKNNLVQQTRKISTHEIDSFADCDTVELTGASYWSEANRSLSPPIVDLADSDEENNDEPFRQEQAELAVVAPPPSELELKSFSLEEFKVLPEIHDLKKSVFEKLQQPQIHQFQTVATEENNPENPVNLELRVESSNPANQSRAASTLESSSNGARVRKLLFECTHPNCGRIFESELKRNAHVQRLHQGIKYPYKCPTCDHGFANFGDLEEHEGSHKDNPLIRCSVSGCSMAFYTKMKLAQHRLIVHSRPNILHRRSENLLKSKKKYREHNKRSHSLKFKFPVNAVKERAMRSYTCPLCRKLFTLQSVLNTHFQRTHKQYRFSKRKAGILNSKSINASRSPRCSRSSRGKNVITVKSGESRKI